VNLPASPTEARAPRTTPAQQQVLDRITAQRQRLRDRRAQRLQARSEADGAQGAAADIPLVQRLAWFTREHPVAVAAVAGAAVMAGPRRLVRWAGAVLPLILQFRGR